jgi:hypothetical protein
MAALVAAVGKDCTTTVGVGNGCIFIQYTAIAVGCKQQQYVWEMVASVYSMHTVHVL